MYPNFKNKQTKLEKGNTYQLKKKNTNDLAQFREKMCYSRTQISCGKLRGKMKSHI